MIRRTSTILVRILAAAGVAAAASTAHAGPSAVSPALAACSKALIETLAKSETLPAYTVKAPSAFVSDLIDPNAFTVYAKNSRRELLAKASCKATPKGEIISFRALPLKS
jgi:hypothetical protein